MSPVAGQTVSGHVAGVAVVGTGVAGKSVGVGVVSRKTVGVAQIVNPFVVGRETSYTISAIGALLASC